MELMHACLLSLVQTRADCDDYVASLVYPWLDAAMKQTGWLRDFKEFQNRRHRLDFIN